MRVHRFRYLIVTMLGLLAACGQATGDGGRVADQPTQGSATQSQAAQPTTAGATIQPMVVSTDLVVGPNRLALAILENNVPIADAAQTKLRVRYYRMDSGKAVLVGEDEARYFGANLGERGVFVTHPTFPVDGPWGLEVETLRPNRRPVIQRLGMSVSKTGAAPIVGAAAPRSKTPTVNEVADLKLLTSDATPDPRFYQLSIDQAVTSGKPSLILFATPGFCQTAVCGPGVEVLQGLADRFGDQVNAVHIEVYRHPFEQLQPVAAMREWSLQTEPWLFVVGKDGKIAARYEGGITLDELEPDVAKLVQ